MCACVDDVGVKLSSYNNSWRQISVPIAMTFLDSDDKVKAHASNGKFLVCTITSLQVIAPFA